MKFRNKRVEILYRKPSALEVIRPMTDHLNYNDSKILLMKLVLKQDQPQELMS